MFYDDGDDDQPVTGDDTASEADPGNEDPGDEIGERIGEHEEKPAL